MMAINRGRALLVQAMQRLPDDFLRLLLDASEGRTEALVARLQAGPISLDDQGWLAVFVDKGNLLHRRQGRPRGSRKENDAIRGTAAEIERIKRDVRALGVKIYEPRGSLKRRRAAQPKSVGANMIRDIAIEIRKSAGLPVPEGEEGLETLQNYLTRSKRPRAPRTKTRAK